MPDIITVDNLVQVYADGTEAVDASWINGVSTVNPISIAVNAIRALTLVDSYSAGTILEAIAIIAGIAVVTMGATLYLFRQVVN